MADERDRPEGDEEGAPEQAQAAEDAVDASSEESTVDEPSEESAVDASSEESAAAESDEPANAEPATAEPATAEPATAEPATAEPATDGQVVAESKVDDSADDDSAEVESAEVESAVVEDSTDLLPPSAGVRADRRVRGGLTLNWGISLVALCAALSAAAVGTLYLRSSAPDTAELPELATLQQGGAARASAIAEQTLVEARQQVERLCAALATEIISGIPAPIPAPAVAPAPAATPPESAAGSQPATPAVAAPATPAVAAPETPPAVVFDAATLKLLRQRIEELRKGYPGLRGAVLAPDGKLAHAIGGPAPGEPPLAELLEAVRAGAPLPGGLVGASSVAKEGAARVVLIVPAPQLPLEELHAARDEEERARVLQARLMNVARDGVAQRDQLARVNLQLFAVAGVGALLVILALLLGVVGPLRRALTEFAFRASERASGRAPPAAARLPRELATADELLARAFEAARAEEAETSARASLSQELDQLIEVCEQASGGDLSARAPEGEGDGGALARNLNLLIESFERRALRLRSHAKAPAIEGERDEAVAELRQRAVSLNAMVQLLADIASRLTGFADRLLEGDEVEPELRRLGEAIAVRTRTARAYLAALHQAIDTVMEEQPGSPDAKLSAQIEAELDGLKLDTSFPAQVGALRDLGPEELRRRIEAEESALADEHEVTGAE